MFRGNRWAGAFVNVMGENAGAALVCLKAMLVPIKSVSGSLFGYSASKQLEAILRENSAHNDTVTEYVIRFIALVVEKKHFGQIDVILQKIEDRLDAQNNVLSVTVESAFPVDSVFEEKLKGQIMERLGAAGVKLKTVVVSDLLGGYRLRIGGFYIDASLKGQMKKMEADLAGGMKYGGL